MNQFEEHARVKKLLRKASWEHSISTYTKGNPDWVMIGASTFLVLFGIVIFISLLI
jgi:hypothetical protein